MCNKKKIPAPEYLKGHDFTQVLKEVLDCKDFSEVSQILDIPKSTFSTWNLHNRTSHELMVRIHLAMGVPIKKLALHDDSIVERIKTDSTNPKTMNSQPGIVAIKSFNLSNGQLVLCDESPYSKRRLDLWNLEAGETIEVDTSKGLFLVDKSQDDAISGDYLIDMNGRISINHIQRLPHKLAVVFGNSTVEVSEDDIKVIGRVTITIYRR